METDYISTAETAQKWGISTRQVQRLLADGRIKGARKYGRFWMIPGDADKACAEKQTKHTPQTYLAAELFDLISSTSMPLPYDNPDAILELTENERARRQYSAELSYLRGDFEKAIKLYKETKKDTAARLRMSLVGIAASISLGDYEAYKEAESFLIECKEIYAGSEVAILADLALSGAGVSAIAPNLAPKWLCEGDFSLLPPGTRPLALYLRAKYYQCTKKFGEMLALAEATLYLSEPTRGIDQNGIYLRLCCAVAAYTLDQKEKACDHLKKAMDIALPHGFIAPFAETAAAMGGLTEQCLKRYYPAHTVAVLELWKSVFSNWISFHNRFTKENVTRILTLREYHIAQLIAKHTPYKTVAKQQGISPGRLGNIIQEIYQKLSVSNREELAKYIM